MGADAPFTTRTERGLWRQENGVSGSVKILISAPKPIFLAPQSSLSD